MSAAFLRAYANIANEMREAGYSDDEAREIKAEVGHYEKVREEVKLASGDYINLKMYEPAMRHLLDTYIRAEESEELSTFDDLTLVELIVERGDAAVDALPEGIRKNPEAVAETIVNNVRRLIIDEMAVNPRYYEKMSELLDALILQRKQEAIDYKDYLSRIVALTEEDQKSADAVLLSFQHRQCRIEGTVRQLAGARSNAILRRRATCGYQSGEGSCHRSRHSECEEGRLAGKQIQGTRGPQSNQVRTR